MLSVLPQIEQDVLIADMKINRKTREETNRTCDAMIDLPPHIEIYVRCFGKIVDKARLLFQSDYDAAISTQRSLLKDHLTDYWACVWISSTDPAQQISTLITRAHELRRLERIRPEMPPATLPNVGNG